MPIKVKKNLYSICSVIVLLLLYNNCGPSFESTSLSSSLSISSGVDLGLPDTTDPEPADPDSGSEPGDTPTASGNTLLSHLKAGYKCNEGSFAKDLKENTFKVLNNNTGPLTRRQYEYSIENIFGFTFYQENKLPTNYRLNGYNNSLGLEFTSDDIIKAQVENAQAVVEKVKAVKSEIFNCSAGSSCLENFVEKYGRLLFRRPLTLDEKNKILATSRDGESAINVQKENALLMLLVSPHFTYHFKGLNLSPNNNELQSLNQYDLLSRLTFFIWGSGPDEYLLDKAKNNLVKKEVVDILKYLLDAQGKPRYLARALAYNWFKMGSFRHSNKTLNYNDININSNQARFYLAEQTQAYIDWMIQENRPLLDLVDSNVMFHNKATSNLYGLNDSGYLENQFSKTASTENHLQSGILSHIGLWAHQSSTSQIHVIKRGTWVRNEFLCSQPVGAPSGEIFSIGETSFNTIKEQVNSLSQTVGCKDCHGKFDHYGKVFEIFNSFGVVRESYDQGESIVYNSSIGGHNISTMQDLTKYLVAEKKTNIGYCTTKNLLTLFLGQNLFDSNVDLLADNKSIPYNQAGSCYALGFYEKYVSDNENVGLRDFIINMVSKGIEALSKTAKLN